MDYDAIGLYALIKKKRISKGKEANWSQTVPGKGWFRLLRLYSPTEA